MKIGHVLISAAITGFVSNGTALAACESFSAKVPIDARYFEYSDVNADGKVDPGDMLFGRDTLYDEHGKETGRLFATVVIDEVDGDGNATKWADTQVYALLGGGIFAFRKVEGETLDVRKLSSESFKQNNTNVTMRIIGGTGAYAGARGAATMSFTEGVGSFEINVSCK